MLYIPTVLVKVHLGYDEGVVRPTTTSGPPIYGQLVSERVRGMLVLELWPYDFALSTKASTAAAAPHMLWKPEVSVFLVTQFALTGLERLPAPGRRWRWVTQRWMCEPRTLQDIQNELRAIETPQFRAMTPTR